jgi:acyl-CoA thioesterase FadM
MNDAAEYVLSRTPFVVRRKARWNECDPAGIVYTGRYTDYLLDAARLYANQVAGGDMMALMREHRLTTPARSMSLEFSRSMFPGDVADIRFWVGGVRDHSFEFCCEASAADGEILFSGRCALICISQETRAKAPIPSALREALLRHTRQEK